SPCLNKKAGRGGPPPAEVGLSEAALVGGLGALGADQLQIGQDGGFHAGDGGQVLIPHLGAGQHRVDQAGGAVVLVGVVEVQGPGIVLDRVGVAVGALAGQAVRGALLDVAGIGGDVGG